jgi:hypothetical protein
MGKTNVGDECRHRAQHSPENQDGFIITSQRLNVNLPSSLPTRSTILFLPFFDKTDVSHTSRIQREARDHIFVIAHEIKRGDGKPEYVTKTWL